MLALASKPGAALRALELALLGLALFGLTAALSPAPAQAGEPRLDATYVGQRTLASGESLPLRTRFFGTPDGLAGSYHFVGDGKMNAGALTFLERQGDVLRFEWTSFNGYGLLEVRLSEDGDRFEGRWFGPGGSKGLWSGRLLSD